RLYAAINAERFDIGIEVGQKICAQTGLLILIEVKPFDQVLLRLIQDLDVHEVCSEIRFLAASQSTKRAFPCSRRRSRSSKRSLCHCGIGTASRRQRSSQRASIARSFSS